MKKSSWLYGLAGFAALPLSIWYGWADSAILVMWPSIASLVIIVLCTPALALQAHGIDGLKHAYSAAVNGGTLPECRRAAAVFRNIKQTLFLMGVFGVLFGLVMMLGNTADEGTITGNLAVCLMSFMYATLLVLYCIQPFLGSVEARMAELEE